MQKKKIGDWRGLFFYIKIHRKIEENMDDSQSAAVLPRLKKSGIVR
jgi:hypothetical protein